MSDRLPELFARALELEDEGRSAFVAELDASDPVAAAELRQLLAGTGPGSPLDFPAWLEEAESDGASPPLPERIGPYRIVSELGRGGMGRVFLAEEETADFRRSVALKVIDRPGFDDDAVRRFRDELRILSALDHPGIARFLHGGRSDEGVWFLALELVRGENLLAWAERRRLDLRQRVELFARALEPVRYAHERGVVHRDLKPSHLLIAADGRPRLLDFGISKLLDPETQASSSVTRTEARALTPAYASPEQFRGEAATPASDVYSLGVVLYELLAGRRPFADVTGAALERAVIESDPDPPSASARRTSPPTAGARTTGSLAAGRRMLSRDLDAICLKALRKDPRDRYPDAGALADDLGRCLDGLPVEARRGGRRYRLGRFLLRHRGRLVTAGAIALAVSALFVAWRAEHRAGELNPAVPEPKPFPYASVGAIPVAELEHRFAAAPADAEAGAAFALGLLNARRLEEAKLIVARLRQIPGEAGNPVTDFVDGRLAQELEEPQRALVLYARSLQGAIAAGRGDLVPQVRATRGRLLALSAQREEGLREMELAAKELEEAGDRASLANTLNDIAIEHLQRGDYDQGAALLRRGIEQGRAAGSNVRGLLLNLGILETVLGHPERALAPLEDLVAAQRRDGRPGQLGQALGVLASVYFELGRPAEADAAYGEGIPLLKRDGETFTLRSAIEAQAQMDVERMRLDRIEPAVAALEERAPSAGDYNATAWIARIRGQAAAARGDAATMRRELARARALLIPGGDADQLADLDALEALAELRSGRTSEAARYADQALSRLPPDDTSEPIVMARLVKARLEAEAGRPETARAWLAKVDPSTASSAGIARRLLFLGARAAISAAEGRDAEARADLKTALAAANAADRHLDGRYLRRDLEALEAPVMAR